MSLHDLKTNNPHIEIHGIISLTVLETYEEKIHKVNTHLQL